MTRLVVDRADLAIAFEQGAGHPASASVLHLLERRLSAFEWGKAVTMAFLAGLLHQPDHEVDARARAAVEGRR